MKSAKQKHDKSKTKKEKRAKKLAQQHIAMPTPRSVGSVAANPTAMAPSNSYSPPPLFYVDRAFTCRDCRKNEVWAATQQKWWCEVAKGDLNSTAVRCRACRRKEQQRKAEARRIHLEGKHTKI